MSVHKFIRWAGGKQSIIKKLLEQLPSKHEHLRLIEPFAGAASLFLNSNFKSAVLIDLNSHLMNTYINIQQKHDAVYEELQKLIINHSKEFYYSVREDFNVQTPETVIQSARFIYLVQSSYNGVFRVNQKGKYNVPFGKLNASFPSYESFSYLHTKLQKAELICSDFGIVTQIATEKDFVYFDPPYMPINQTSYFQHYTNKRFTYDCQEKLSQIAKIFSERKIKTMISGPDLEMFKNLYYDDYNVSTIGVIRYISCKKEREKISEIILKNY